MPRTKADLVQRTVDEDVVVYDPDTDRVALLNPAAFAVFALCDGTRAPSAIAEEIRRELATDGRAELSGDLDGAVQAALARFARLGLLDGGARRTPRRSPDGA